MTVKLLIQHLLIGDVKSQQGHGNSFLRAHDPTLVLAMLSCIPGRNRPMNVYKSHETIYKRQSIRNLFAKKGLFWSASFLLGNNYKCSNIRDLDP